MFSTDKKVMTNVSVDMTGKSVIDDELVALYCAHIDPNEDKIAITITIFDKEKYKSDCSADESEFEKAVYESQEQIMDKQEEIAGLFKEDEPDDGDKTGAGNEETIIP